MRRVTRPGGALAAAVWDYAGEMVMLREFWDAAVALDAPAAPLAESRTMTLSTPGELSELWSSAGLSQVRTAPIVVSAGFDGFADLWDPFVRGVGPAGAYVLSLDERRRDALAGEYRRRLGVDDEPFSLPARAWAVTGRVP
jgi:hypothetical protein